MNETLEASLSLPLFIHAANIGFMLMFTIVVAPAVFKVLSQKAAASYLRVLFPRLFIFGFLFNALILTPKINQFRDRASAGEVAAEKAFARLHLLSVTIFGSQFLASLYLIISQTYFT